MGRPRSFSTSRICRVKRSFKIQPSTSTYPSYPKEPAYAVSATNMPFEADQAEKTFHFLQGSRSQSFTFLAKVTIEEVFYRGISSRIAGLGVLFSLDFQACAQSPRWATRCSFGSVSCSCSCDAAPRTVVRK